MVDSVILFLLFLLRHRKVIICRMWNVFHSTYCSFRRRPHPQPLDQNFLKPSVMDSHPLPNLAPLLTSLHPCVQTMEAHNQHFNQHLQSKFNLVSLSQAEFTWICSSKSDGIFAKTAVPWSVVLMENMLLFVPETLDKGFGPGSRHRRQSRRLTDCRGKKRSKPGIGPNRQTNPKRAQARNPKSRAQSKVQVT